MGESEEVVQWGFNGRERGGFRLVLGEGIVSVLELYSSVLINPTRTLECFFCSSEHGGWKVWKAQ